MDHFNYENGNLHVEAVAVAEIAQKYGTPCYIYSRATLERHWHAFNDALGEHPHMICYAVKANSNIAILNVLARLGSGFDVVSRGELERVLVAKGDPDKVVFSGVGKQNHEIERALEVGIHCFNVESGTELAQINQIAKTHGVVAPIALRVNPDIDAKTHPYIATGLHGNKFGIETQSALQLYAAADAFPHCELIGVDCHIGSQLTELSPFIEALEHLMEVVTYLKSNGIALKHVDLGGGLGVRYQNETPPHPYDQAAAIREHFDQDLEIILEPGRAIAANAGILVTRLLHLKENAHKTFAVVDAAMNDLLRPALYNAWQDIIPVQQSDATPELYDVVGPVCESGDFLGNGRKLAISPDDLLAVRGAGAYGFVMSSNYNSRPRACEILVDNHDVHLIRRRESYDDLYAHESLIS